MNISKQKIELLQAEQGLTTVAFSKLAGISRQSISTIKQRGTCNPINAAKLAAALGVSVAQIAEGV